MSFEAERAELSAFHAEMISLAARISAPLHLLPLAGRGSDPSDCAWIDVRGYPPGFIYSRSYEERGEREVTAESADREEVLEHIFSSVTQSMATAWDVQTRGDAPYRRERWFAYQETLMGQLKPEWAVNERARHARLLAPPRFKDRMAAGLAGKLK